MATPATTGLAAVLQGGGHPSDPHGKARWILGGAIVFLLMIVATLTAIFAAQQQQACTPNNTPGADDPPDLTTMEVATRVYLVGKEMGVNERVMISAFITVLIESGGGVQMRNLACRNPGDCHADSVGAFQQRDIAPWNRRNRRNVSDAARSYFEVATGVDRPGLPPSEISLLTQRPHASTYHKNRDPKVYARAVEILERVRAAEIDGKPLPNHGRGGVAGAGSDGPERMIWPTSSQSVISEYGPRWGRIHEGIDIPVPEGTPVYAVLTGRIVYRGWMQGYGNFVCIAHHARLTTCYAHLSRFGTGQLNETVAQGTVIAYSGNTGNSQGPHLHFETREGDGFGAPAVDPRRYLGQAAPAPDGETEFTGGLPCAYDTADGAGDGDLSKAVKTFEPRKMEYLPAWATADGYTSPAIHNGRARADARIIPNILWILRRYNLRVHDCLASDHNTHGTGDSCDLVPADDPLPRPGRMTPGWKNVERLARDLGWKPPGPGYPGGYACNSGAPFVPAIAFLCYNGDVNHGDPAAFHGPCGCPHIHITWKSPITKSRVEMDRPPEWVMTFPITPAAATDDDVDGLDVAMVGDSLAVGTEPYLADALERKKVRTNARQGRTLSQGLDVIRGLRRKPDVLAVSLFTNDDPRNVDALASGVRASLNHVAEGGCVVWATIHRPPVGGVTYERANRRLRALAAELPRLVVVDWNGLVSQKPALLADDRVHATATGYQVRAELYAAGIRSCAR